MASIRVFAAVGLIIAAMGDAKTDPSAASNATMAKKADSPGDKTKASKVITADGTVGMVEPEKKVADKPSSGIVRVGEVSKEIQAGTDTAKINTTAASTKAAAKATKAGAAIKKANSTVVTKANATAVGNAAAGAAAKAVKEEVHKHKDLGFFDIIFIWQSELLRCIPVMILAYGALSLAVYHPKMVEMFSHWKMVRIVTAKPQKEFAMGGGFHKQQGVGSAYSTFSL